MQLPINGSMDAPPFFHTEYAHDIITFNGVNYSGVSGEIGGWPQNPVRVKDRMMYWRSDEKIVGAGWNLEFRIPLPRASPDPDGNPQVWSGQCMMGYSPERGSAYISSPFYPDGEGSEDCVFIVPQGWYLSAVRFSTRSEDNFLTVNGQQYSGNAGPPVGLQLNGLIRWHAPSRHMKDECVNTKPFVCGFYIQLTKLQPTSFNE